MKNIEKLSVKAELWELIHYSDINIRSDFINYILDSLNIDFYKDKDEYTAVLIHEPSFYQVTIMQSNLDGKSDNALFQKYLSEFSPINLETFILATLNYISENESIIEEQLDELSRLL